MTASYDEFDMRDSGRRMQNWHRSMGDPVYAVGSFFVDGKDYPDKSVVLQAKANLESNLREGCTERNGWTEDDMEELKDLIEFLGIYLAERWP